MLGDLEQRIMNVIWESDRPLKPAEVLKRMECDLAYTTIMTVMKRLVDKDLLTRKKQGNVYYYSVATPKREYAKDNLGELFSSLVDSYGNLAISQFVETVRENPQDLKQLKEYLDKQL
ncbi:MAG: Transcriptional regulator BlaI [candidate division WS6 bacterium OLB20]|uniref:Transcriptional regulator BlaI n=1 Tax=candidate division WS6 bacterium OLB20 TaxID=1617426 RepID=A0A136M042_9BACT|nr:MAG: Transcriptional regulator BlaI [candidate division WS6 bacterium OLB20]